jgi:hypothetical protein
MIWKSQSASRMVLFVGCLLYLLTLSDIFYTPFLSTTIISTFNLTGMEKNCEKSFVRRECRYPSPDPDTEKKLSLSPCPSCLENIRCQWCMAIYFAKYTVTVIFFLSILSVLLSPFKTRTMKGYYARIVLIIFSGMFSFGAHQIFIFPVIVWGPVVMITRRRWYPLPTDKNL